MVFFFPSFFGPLKETPTSQEIWWKGLLFAHGYRSQESWKNDQNLYFDM